jgi:hypothetical protein
MAKLADTVNALNKKIEQMESEKAKESGDTKRKK